METSYKHKSIGSTSIGGRNSVSSEDSAFTSPIVNKEGVLKSQKYVGMNHKLDKAWTISQVKIFNNVLVVDYNKESFKANDIPVAWELQLSGLKHVFGPDVNGQFSITAKREAARLIIKENENVKKKRRRSTKYIMEEVGEDHEHDMDMNEFVIASKEKELMGNSRDVCFFFKADNLEMARDWVDVFNAGKEFANDSPVDILKEKHKSLAAALSPYNKAGNIMSKTKGRGSRINKRKTPKSKATGLASRGMEEMDIEDEFFPSGTDLPEWQHSSYSIGRTAAFLFSILSISFVGSIIFVVLTITNAKRKEKRKIATMLEETLISALIWILPKVRIHVSGEAPTSYAGSKLATDAPKVIIMNRSCQLDFLYACMLANEVKQSGHVRAIVKSNLKLIPIIGPILSWFRFLFLSGDGEEDDIRIEAYMSRLGSNKSEWLVFFPETGNVNHKLLQKSKRIAEASNRPVLNHLLLPESDILENCLSHIKNHDTEIYDLTVQYKGFSGEIPLSMMGWDREKDVMIPTLMKLLNGRASNQIFIDSQLWKLGDVLNHPGGVQGWLDESWQRKDELTKEFIKEQKFPTDGKIKDVFTPSGKIIDMLKLWSMTFVSFTAFMIVAIITAWIRRLGK